MIALGHRVRIESLTSEMDAWGQSVESWRAIAEVWADVRHLSGLETIKADAQSAVTRVSIRIRHRAGITPTMRVIYDGVAHDIKAVLPDGRRQFIDLACEVIA